jgi:hypothetical protein
MESYYCTAQVWIHSKQKSHSISLNADPSGFSRISGTFPGNHLIPPEGFRCTAFGCSLTINEKSERHRTDSLIYRTVTSYLSTILISFNIFCLTDDVSVTRGTDAAQYKRN